MPTPVEEVYPFGLLVKSWATGLDYFSQSFPPNPQPSQPPTTPIPDGATWKLPPMTNLFVPISGSSTPATVSAVAMTWDTFEGILHNANNIGPLGAITNPTNATSVVIVQGDTNTLVLRLPPKLRLQRSEKSMLSGGAYRVEGFYDQLYQGAGGATVTRVVPKSTDPGGSAALLRLSANRVGDYTMSNCDD